MSGEAKVYAPCSVKEVQTQYGSLLNVSCQAEGMAEWLREHANERGWVNLCVTRRKSEGKYGETHSAYLDTWRPEQPAAPAPAAEPAPAPAPAPEAPAADDDSVPY